MLLDQAEVALHYLAGKLIFEFLSLGSVFSLASLWSAPLGIP